MIANTAMKKCPYCAELIQDEIGIAWSGLFYKWTDLWIRSLKASSAPEMESILIQEKEILTLMDRLEEVCPDYRFLGDSLKKLGELRDSRLKI